MIDILLKLTYKQRIELLLSIEKLIMDYELLGWHDRIALLKDIQEQVQERLYAKTQTKQTHCRDSPLPRR